MIVCKFGGSCTASAVAIHNIEKIKKRDSRRRIFVFSAIGKATAADEKMTDLLFELSNASQDSTPYQTTKEKIISKLESLVDMTGVNYDVKQKFSVAEKKFQKTKDKDFLVSRGEYFTTEIMAMYLGIKFVPAEKVLFFKNEDIDIEKTSKRLKLFLKRYKKIAICGFYGADENGNIELLSRGGGDFSGAIFSKLAKAKTYENWTDVEGIYQINPKFVKSKIIKRLSYSQLAIMTAMDTTVIHRDCAKFLTGGKTKLKIRSCFNPTSKYTLVSNRKCKNAEFICFQLAEDTATIYVHTKNETKTLMCPEFDLDKTIKEENKKLKQKN